MLFKTDGTTFEIYSTCFAVLAIPGAVTLILLIVTRCRFPNPEHFEPEPKEYIPFRMKKEFILYIAGISLFRLWLRRLFHHNHACVAHVFPPRLRPFGDGALVSTGTLPLLYAGGDAGERRGALVFRADV